TEEGDGAEIAADFIMKIAGNAQAEAREAALGGEPDFVDGAEQKQDQSGSKEAKGPGLPKVRQNGHGERRAVLIPDTVVVAGQHTKFIFSRRNITIMGFALDTGIHPIFLQV